MWKTWFIHNKNNKCDLFKDKNQWAAWIHTQQRKAQGSKCGKHRIFHLSCMKSLNCEKIQRTSWNFFIVQFLASFEASSICWNDQLFRFHLNNFGNGEKSFMSGTCVQIEITEFLTFTRVIISPTFDTRRCLWRALKGFLEELSSLS